MKCTRSLSGHCEEGSLSYFQCRTISTDETSRHTRQPPGCEECRRCRACWRFHQHQQGPYCLREDLHPVTASGSFSSNLQSGWENDDGYQCPSLPSSSYNLAILSFWSSNSSGHSNRSHSPRTRCRCLFHP